MSKILWLGDPHIMSSNISESERLLQFVYNQASSNETDMIVILGDLMHTFGVVRVEVLNFWKKWLEILSVNRKVYVLVGNHDFKNQSNDHDKDHALETLSLIDNANLFIVQSPTAFKPFGFMPYIHDKEMFVRSANHLADVGAKILVCHGEYNGAKFESGFYVPDGIDPDEIKSETIISGHIHSRQRFGKVIYPGTARWLTASDANEPKGLWLTEHDQNGKILKESYIDTSSVCTPICNVQYKEGDSEPTLIEGAKTALELIGTSEWVSKQKVRFKGSASISCKITDKQKTLNRKTGNNLEHFLKNVFEPTQGVNREKMFEFMKEMGVL